MCARSSGSVVWMETKSGPRRSVRMRSASSSVNRVKRGEVPVEEREPVVVVLEVQAAPHALGQLVDEAERAVVVAGADAVEDGRGDLDAERLAGRLVDAHEPGQRRAGAPDQDAEVVASLRRWKSMTSRGSCPFEAEELVAHGQAGPGCRRRRGDRSHRGS